MRTSRTLLALAAAALLTACASDAPSPVLPADRAVRDGTGFSGSGNSIGDDPETTTSSDSTTDGRGTGFSGSGN